MAKIEVDDEDREINSARRFMQGWWKVMDVDCAGKTDDDLAIYKVVIGLVGGSLLNFVGLESTEAILDAAIEIAYADAVAIEAGAEPSSGPLLLVPYIDLSENAAYSIADVLLNALSGLAFAGVDPEGLTTAIRAQLVRDHPT